MMYSQELIVCMRSQRPKTSRKFRSSDLIDYARPFASGHLKKLFLEAERGNLSSTNDKSITKQPQKKEKHA